MRPLALSSEAIVLVLVDQAVSVNVKLSQRDPTDVFNGKEREDRMTIHQRVCVRIRAVVLLAFAALITPTMAHAQQCQPGIDAAWETQRPSYDLLWALLIPRVGLLSGLVQAITDQPTYATLLSTARSIAAEVSSGRLVVTLPDGTVVVDTVQPDGDFPANANSYAHFKARSINENHNTRVAIMAAQTFPCGIGIETRPTVPGNAESHFAARLGAHLNSSGTARLSIFVSGLGAWDY